jgi:hypothetical protein
MPSLMAAALMSWFLVTDYFSCGVGGKKKRVVS